MKKIIISGFVIVAFILYSVQSRHEQNSAAVAPPTSLQNNASSNTSSLPAAALAPSGNGQTSTSSGYKDGTYTGSAADAFYGNIQVQATISGGRITDVTFLQYPNDRGTSIQINSQAMPYLKQEAIQAQSAQVDGVSGATDTSQAFIQSLSSALQQAKG